MNIFKSSFLIIGEGITFEYCSNFFKDNDIIYYSTTTDDIIDINNSFFDVNKAAVIHKKTI